MSTAHGETTGHKDFWSTLPVGINSADWRIGLAVALVTVAMWALVSAWITPRGPITTPQALTAMIVAGLVGVAGGFAMRNHWSLLAFPITFIAVFELARVGTDGPTVDGLFITSTYGVIAFIVGRGMHGVLVLLPMMLGAVYGIHLAHRLIGSPAGSMGWIS